MAYLYTIRLEKLQYYAYHGVHQKEKECGNHFQVDVAITLQTEHPIETLSQTVDYVQVAEIIENIMTGNSTDLLETLAHNIIENVYRVCNVLPVQKILVKVSKFNPPIKQICQISSVELEKQY
jgi:dihydroneopterin aldolase